VTVTPPQPLLRQEGFTELTADIVLTCVGAPGSSPTQAPNVIPQANITVSMTAPVTSRILPGGTLSTPLTDALLVVDDPSPGATYPALGNQNPCYSPLNPAVACQVVGDGGLTFNQPGKFNTFQGIGGGPGSNSVTFLGVPVDPPGPGLAVRTYRITNIRIDATNVGANNFTPVLAFVTSSSSTSMQIENPVNEVGFVSYGLTTSTSAVGLAFPECGPTAFTQVGSVTFTENFATAFKVAGSTGQNVPGTVYNTESGLEIAVTGTAGPADTGTRLQVVLTGIPIGVTVWVDDWAQSTAATGSIPSDATLVAGTVYVPPIDPVSNQPQQALPGTSATFVWEVTNTNPGAIDSLTFNIYVSINTFAIMGNALSLSGFSPQQASATSPMTGPIPEFSSTVNQPPSPTNIITVGLCILGEVVYSGTGRSGVTLALNGSQTGSATTNDSGRYNFTVAAGGNYTVTPSLDGYIFKPHEASFNDMTSSQRASFTALQDQTIAFAKPPNKTLGAPPFMVSATASSGLAVSFASASTSVCSVTGSTVTLLAVGICTIHATQPGNASYAPATPVNRSFQVYAVPTYTTIFSFDGADGSLPAAGLVQGTDGAFYGTTENTNGKGTIYKVTPAGAETTLYTFCSQSGCPDGQYPQAVGLVQALNGDFYGATAGGGAYGNGTIYKITPSGTLTTLYSFCAQTGCPDGQSPNGLIQVPNGTFYGTTLEGGNYGSGTIFQMTPDGALTTLYKFCPVYPCQDGGYPQPGLARGSDGDLYGTTNLNSSGPGTMFKISPTGAFATLYTFCSVGPCSDGSSPAAGPIESNGGDFYGTTAAGGVENIASIGGGTVFKITPAGTLTTLYRFCSQNGCPDGATPQTALVQATDGNFYGTTWQGGANGLGASTGTIFRIGPDGGLTTLYNFCPQGGCPYGANTAAPLIQATDGNFYGTTQESGASGHGSVFRLSVGLGPFVETRPTAGAAGATVEILGTDMTGATSVSFNGTAAAFTVNASGTLISTTVPAGAASGKVLVTTPSGTLSSNVSFQVLP
jgi:uncharacterized repeat protein (TIGR03803 family)